MKYAFITYTSDNKHFDIMELDEANYQKALKRTVATGYLLYCTKHVSTKMTDFDFGFPSINVTYFDTKEELTAAHFIELL